MDRLMDLVTSWTRNPFCCCWSKCCWIAHPLFIGWFLYNYFFWWHVFNCRHRRPWSARNRGSMLNIYSSPSGNPNPPLPSANTYWVKAYAALFWWLLTAWKNASLALTTNFSNAKTLQKFFIILYNVFIRIHTFSLKLPFVSPTRDQ